MLMGCPAYVNYLPNTRLRSWAGVSFTHTVMNTLASMAVLRASSAVCQMSSEPTNFSGRVERLICVTVKTPQYDSATFDKAMPSSGHTDYVTWSLQMRQVVHTSNPSAVKPKAVMMSSVRFSTLPISVAIWSGRQKMWASSCGQRTAYLQAIISSHAVRFKPRPEQERAGTCSSAKTKIRK